MNQDNSFEAIKARDDAYMRANGRYSCTNAGRAAHDRGILVGMVLDLRRELAALNPAPETGVRYCPHCGKSEPHEHQGRPYPSPPNTVA